MGSLMGCRSRLRRKDAFSVVARAAVPQSICQRAPRRYTTTSNKAFMQLPAKAVHCLQCVPLLEQVVMR